MLIQTSRLIVDGAAKDGQKQFRCEILRVWEPSEREYTYPGYVVVFFLPSGLQNHIDICLGVDLQFQMLSDFNSVTWPALAIRDHVKIERRLLSTISVQLLGGDLRGD